MAKTLVKIIANFQNQLSAPSAVSDTSLTLVGDGSDIVDSDGVVLAAGDYGFTIDEGSSTEEHIIATYSGAGLSLTSVKHATRGAATATAGLNTAHRRGAIIKITDHPALRRVIDNLDGTTGFNSGVKLGYDADPGLISTDTEKIATVRYVNGVALASAPDAATSVKGVSKVSVAPVSPTNPIVVGDNDPRVPTQNENDALAGTSGTPVSSANKLVDNSDTSQTAVAGKVARFDANGLLPVGAVVNTYTAGENLSIGDAVYLKASDGRVYKASAAAYGEALYNFVGIVTAAATTGNSVVVTSRGITTVPSLGAASTTIAEAVDQSETNSATNLWTGDGTGKYFSIQFITGDTVGNITAFELKVGKTGTPGDVLTCSLYATETTGIETGAALGSFTISNADVTIAGGTTVKKTLNATLAPRTRYILKCVYGTYIATNYFAIYGNNTVTLTRTGWFNNNTTFIGAFTGQTLPYFKTYYTESRAYYLNDNVYLSDSSGAIGVNEGTYRIKIGRVLSATTIYVDPTDQQDIPLGVSGLDLGGTRTSATMIIPVPRNAKKVIIMNSNNSSFDGGVTSKAEILIKNFSTFSFYGAISAGVANAGGKISPSAPNLLITWSTGTAGNPPAGERYYKWYWFK